MKGKLKKKEQPNSPRKYDKKYFYAVQMLIETFLREFGIIPDHEVMKELAHYMAKNNKHDYLRELYEQLRENPQLAINVELYGQPSHRGKVRGLVEVGKSPFNEFYKSK
jgi:hypothetical protein